MSKIVEISSRMPVRKKFVPRSNTDELAQIGHPELLLSNALARLRVAAVEVANIKPGSAGESDAICEVIQVFRGPEWERMLFGVDDDVSEGTP